MRSVPHRVVCLLGLDDGIFPRSRGVDGDDVLARTPLTGERDIRSEDRQLLLDAVFAATEVLVVTYTGADEIGGQPRPPAVPLGELLDALDTTVPGARDRATHHHPLQAFDRRNLVAGEFHPRGPFSFDPAALAGARAASRPRQQPKGFLGEPLPPLEAADVDLATLSSFFRHPVATFLRRRIGISLPEDGEAVSDSLPVDVDNLVAWGIGDRLLRERIRGADLRQALELEWRRGVLPPGQLGWRRAKAIMEQVDPLAQAARAVTGDHAVTSLDVDVDIDGTRRLRGTVTDVYGDAVVKVMYSRLAPKHQIDAWLSLVALCAAQPDREWRAGAIGRGSGGQAVAQVVFGRIDDAADVLRSLIDIFDAGMREPLPLPLLTGYAWAQSSSEGAARKAAEGAWSKDKYKAEVTDPFHVRVWGAGAPLDVLLESAPAPGEQYDGETTRLGALARRLWQPILEAART
jgi:exodeoxyribonuclease V gamma subunit